MKYNIKYQFLLSFYLLATALHASDLPIKRDFIPKCVLGGTAALTVCAYIAKSVHINLSAAVSFCAFTAKHYWPQLMVATSFGVVSVLGIKKTIEASLISKLDFKLYIKNESQPISSNDLNSQQLLSLGTNFRLALKDCSAAGILPYAIYNREIFFLLGLDQVHDDAVGNFGGQKDKDDSTIAMIAARESAEELMYLFDEKFSDEAKVKETNSYKKLLPAEDCPCVVNLKNNYCMYFVKVDYDDSLPNKFETRRESYIQSKPENRLQPCLIEIKKIMWVSAEPLIEKIASMGEDDINKMQDEKTNTKIGEITYFRYFIQSLWYAHKNKCVSDLL